MLALTRRVGEEIVLSKDGKKIATVRVVAVHGDKVRLSWDALDWVQIDRLELWEAKERDKKELKPCPVCGSGNWSCGH